jgi:hypothetical protein
MVVSAIHRGFSKPKPGLFAPLPTQGAALAARIEAKEEKKGQAQQKVKAEAPADLVVEDPLEPGSLAVVNPVEVVVHAADPRLLAAPRREEAKGRSKDQEPGRILESDSQQHGEDEIYEPNSKAHDTLAQHAHAVTLHT